MKIKKFIAVIAVMIAATMPSFACYCGLVLIPTTDTVGARQYGIEFQTDGSISKPKADTFIFNSQYGITDDIEAGIDYDFSKDSDARLLFNGKYVFFKNEDKKLAIAAGICNLGKHSKSNPYMVGTQDFKIIRGHVGLMEIDEKTRYFIGIDRDINDKLNLMADYTNGDDNYSSFGANYQITDKCGVLAGIELPNSGGETLFTLHLCLSGGLTK